MIPPTPDLTPAAPPTAPSAARVRVGEFRRETRETRVSARVSIGPPGESSIRTGIGFLDHLLTALATHAGLVVQLECTGDLDTDDHHSAEDSAIAFAEALRAAIGPRRDFARFGTAYAPLDESLARAVVDICGRPCAVVNLGLTRERIGGLSCENIPHVVRTLAQHLGAAIHLDTLRGENDHHRAEAAFKALALALRAAIAPTPDSGVPSTKGVL